MPGFVPQWCHLAAPEYHTAEIRWTTSALAPLPALVDAVSGAPLADVDLVRPTLYTLLAPVTTNAAEICPFMIPPKQNTFRAAGLAFTYCLLDVFALRNVCNVMGITR